MYSSENGYYTVYVNSEKVNEEDLAELPDMMVVTHDHFTNVIFKLNDRYLTYCIEISLTEIRVSTIPPCCKDAEEIVRYTNILKHIGQNYTGKSMRRDFDIIYKIVSAIDPIIRPLFDEESILRRYYANSMMKRA